MILSLNCASGIGMTDDGVARSVARRLYPDNVHDVVDWSVRLFSFPGSVREFPSLTRLIQLNTSSAFQPSLALPFGNTLRHALSTSQQFHRVRKTTQVHHTPALPRLTQKLTSNYRRTFLRRRRWIPLNCFGRFRRSLSGRRAIRNFSCARSFDGASISRSNS